MHIYIEIKVDAFIRIHKEDGQKKHIYKYLHRGHIKVDGFIRIHNDWGRTKEDAILHFHTENVEKRMKLWIHFENAAFEQI